MKIDMLPVPGPVADPASESETSAGAEARVVAISHTRLLTPAEISSIEPIFKEHGGDLPDPATSFIVGSTDDTGKVVAFLAVQLKVHAQPMWIEPGHEALFRPLVHEVERVIAERVNGCEVYLFAPAGKAARLAEVSGMRLEPWLVYSKFIPGIGQSDGPTVTTTLDPLPPAKETETIN